MSADQLEVMEELRLEIAACSDPEEKAELERTLDVCQEFAYGLAEGLIYAVEGEDKELHYYAVA